LIIQVNNFIFKGERTEEGFLKWLKEHATHDWVEVAAAAPATEEPKETKEETKEET